MSPEPCIGVQVILCGQPELVSLAAALLHTVLQYAHEALATLYRTGVFYFALAYCGSNLVELACLLQVLPPAYSMCRPCTCQQPPGQLCATCARSPTPDQGRARATSCTLAVPSVLQA